MTQFADFKKSLDWRIYKHKNAPESGSRAVVETWDYHAAGAGATIIWRRDGSAKSEYGDPQNGYSEFQWPDGRGAVWELESRIKARVAGGLY